MMNKKMMAIILGVVISISAVSCTNKDSAKGNNKKEAVVEERETPMGKVEVPNPNKEYKSIEELKKATEFNFNIPSELEGYEIKSIIMIEDKIAAINYMIEDREAQFRASVKVSDISGVYGDFKEKEIEIDNIKVKLKEKEGKIYVATWSHDGVNYSFSVSNGIDEEGLRDLLK